MLLFRMPKINFRKSQYLIHHCEVYLNVLNVKTLLSIAAVQPRHEFTDIFHLQTHSWYQLQSIHTLYSCLCNNQYCFPTISNLCISLNYMTENTNWQCLKLQNIKTNLKINRVWQWGFDSYGSGYSQIVSSSEWSNELWKMFHASSLLHMLSQCMAFLCQQY